MDDDEVMKFVCVCCYDIFWLCNAL